MSIPSFPGVPALLSGFSSFTPPPLLTSDSVSALIGAGPAQWGIFDQSGGLVLTPDSFVSLEYRHDWKISDYPIEKGQFSSYNKVQTPFQTKVVMTKGGTQADRNAFLTAVEAAANSIDLYNVVTPDYTYLNVNIEHYELRRSSTNGVSLLTIELWLVQIRTTATSTLNNTQQPQSASLVNTGVVQPVTPTIPQINSVVASSQSVAGGSLTGVPPSTLGALNGLSSVTGLNPTLLSPLQGWGSNVSVLAKLPGLAAGTLNPSNYGALPGGLLRSWGNAAANIAPAIVANSLRTR